MLANYYIKCNNFYHSNKKKCKYTIEWVTQFAKGDTICIGYCIILKNKWWNLEIPKMVS